MLRIRLSTILIVIAIIAVLLAVYRLKPRHSMLEIVPFELFIALLAIILVNLVILLQAFRRK